MLPRLVHFIFGLAPLPDPTAFGLHHLICVKSARMHYPDHELVMWHGYEPENNPYWRAAAKLCRMVALTPPTQIFGNPLTIHAHRTDVLRLQVLIEHGGLYLDLDSVVLRPLDDVFVPGALMGVEAQEATGKVHGLCNAVIAAAPRANFLRRWLDCFEFFNSTGADAGYAFYASRLPLILARQRNDDIIMLGNRAFFPYWCDAAGLRAIFDSDHDAPKESYSLHLWESQARQRGHFSGVTLAAIREPRALYHRLAARCFSEPELQEIEEDVKSTAGLEAK